jgi:L-ascorbate metabolism protein UlaG (beta-lactamase superfamily)
MQEDLAVKVTYLSHACFEVKDQHHTILIDPFFTKENPFAPHYSGEPDIILITHEHFDHIDARKFNSLVVAPPTLSGKYKEMITMKVGDRKLVKNVGITMIGVSHHQSKYPAGYIFELGGIRFAHLGDTYLDGVQRLANIDVLFIPIGGFFTMDVNDAVKALDIIKPKTAMPMHFNTFDQIKADPHKFKQLAENAGHNVMILPVGGSTTF